MDEEKGKYYTDDPLKFNIYVQGKHRLIQNNLSLLRGL